MWFLLWPIVIYKYVGFKIFEKFPDIFIYLPSNLICCGQKKYFVRFKIFKIYWDIETIVWSILLNVPYALEKIKYSIVTAGEMFYKYQLGQVGW